MAKEAAASLDLEAAATRILTATSRPELTQRSSGSSTQHPFGEDKPIYLSPGVGHGLGSPTALAIGAFATTLTTLSISLMEWRGVTTTNVYIGNFFFVAGIGMLISAQWELVKGNSFAYTVLSAFGGSKALHSTFSAVGYMYTDTQKGLFYAGFGAIITPDFGVLQAYGGDITQYNNALGFWMLLWTVFNTFFLIASAPINVVYLLIFLTVELSFGLVAASYFATADGHHGAGINLKKAGGAFGFASGLLGYYTLGHLMCQEALFFTFPMGDTGRFFRRRLKKNV
ncbi:hypothetical protein PV08_05944 [Exophiala spinifera]|uniref:Acetate transporter n=1 Tax=Exophiala spinifera TaxID=91928 RepID=A0A0D2BX70_9EURO|nr:uncharacterized protein PV08_05944 [Exophiala spinifera]KIW15894.1 hypothetical protein PV08_05944 [Exophiala spinifera]